MKESQPPLGGMAWLCVIAGAAFAVAHQFWQHDMYTLLMAILLSAMGAYVLGRARGG